MATSYDGTDREERALNLLIHFRRAAQSLRERCGTYREAGLTASQFGTLDAVYHLGPMHQKEIGRKILKTEANMTTVIDNLEERDLVERTRDPDDRRCFNISLTNQGTELFESIFSDHVDRVVDVFDVLTPDEQKTLSRLCKKLGTTSPDNPDGS